MNIFGIIKEECLLFENKYRLEHTAPDSDSGVSMSNVDELYGDDILKPNAARLFSHYRDSRDNEAISIIQNAHNKPNEMIKVYRAIPDEYDQVINDGDWVSITKPYATDHGNRNIKGSFNIVEASIPARHLYTDANSIFEWGVDDFEEA